MAMEDYRINKENGLEFGLYSLGDHMPNALTGKRVSAKERIDQIVAEAKLAEEGIDVSVVSMPSMELFEKQSDEYKNTVLPRGVKKRIAIEAGSSFGWRQYVKCKGKIISIDEFGASAPGNLVLDSFGFNVENVVNTFKSF